MAVERENRRRFVRRNCVIPVKLCVYGIHFPLFGEATDVSPGGCYFKSSCPLAVGVTMDVILWLGAGSLSFKGKVRTADAGLGNGIEFTGINEEQRSRLVAHLDAIAPFAASGITFR